jgi:heme exporter protein B
MSSLFFLEIKKLLQHGGKWMQMAVFFIICLLLLPLSSNTSFSGGSGISIILVAVWLSIMLSGSDFFTSDFENGSLEVWLNSAIHPFFIVNIKVISYWLISSIFLTPLLVIGGVLFSLEADVIIMLVCVTAVGVFLLSFLLSLGNALLLTAYKAHLLLPIIIFPIMIAEVIFSAQAVISVYNGTSYDFFLLMIIAQAIANFLLTPWLTIFALRLSISD